MVPGDIIKKNTIKLMLLGDIINKKMKIKLMLPGDIKKYTKIDGSRRHNKKKIQ